MNRKKYNNKTFSRNDNNKKERKDVDSVNNNNRTLLVGPSFSGKTYLMLKIFSRIPDRDIYIITKSPLEQYSNSKIKIKEISNEFKPLNKYENCVIVFDDILGSSNSKYIDQIYHNRILIYQKEV